MNFSVCPPEIYIFSRCCSLEQKTKDLWALLFYIGKRLQPAQSRTTSFLRAAVGSVHHLLQLHDERSEDMKRQLEGATADTQGSTA